MARNPTPAEARSWLADSVDRRFMPAWVAYYAAHADLPVSESTKGALARVSRTISDHFSRYGFGSSMSSDWHRVSSAGPIIESIEKDLSEWGVPHYSPGSDHSDPKTVRNFADSTALLLGLSLTSRVPGYKARTAIKELGLSQRRYNRLVRAVRALDDKATRMAFEADVRLFAQLGRGGFATQLDPKLWEDNPTLGALISYVVAKRNERRLFSIKGKDSIKDEVVSGLLADLPSDSKWAELAAVWPDPQIMERLDAFEAGRLAGNWYGVMVKAAAFMGKLAESFTSPIDRKEFIVAAGQDSDSWNLAAQAYNEARAGWISALKVSGLDHVLDAVCPPKAMRMMAYDLARWGRAAGTFPHRDTMVAARLPLPHEVLIQEVPCRREDVVRGLAAASMQLTLAGRHEELSGWVEPRLAAGFSAFKPTPELVHGVVVGDPLMAALLRRAGVFSGKDVDEALAVQAFEFIGPEDFDRLIERPGSR